VSWRDPRERMAAAEGIMAQTPGAEQGYQCVVLEE